MPFRDLGRASSGAARWGLPAAALLGVAMVSLGLLALTMLQNPSAPTGRVEAGAPAAIAGSRPALGAGPPAREVAPAEPASAEAGDADVLVNLRPAPARPAAAPPTSAEPLGGVEPLDAAARPAASVVAWPPPPTRSRKARSARPTPSRARAFTTAEPGGADAHIDVVVLATESGEPIEGAIAELRRAGDTLVERPTDRDGRARFTHSEPNELLLVVSAHRRVPLRRRIHVRAGRSIVIRAELDAAVALDGVVTYRWRPERDVTLEAYDADAFMGALPAGRTGPLLAETTSGANGRYELDGLPRVSRLVVVARHPTLATQTLLLETGPDSESIVTRDIVLFDAVSSRGWVVDASGEPVKGAIVYAVPARLVERAATGWAHVDMTDEQVDELAAADALFRLAHDDWAAEVVATRGVTDDAGFVTLEGLLSDENHHAMAVLRSGAHSTTDGASWAGRPGQFNLRMHPLVDVTYRPVTSNGGRGWHPRFRHPWRHVQLALTELREPGVWGTARVSGGATAIEAGDDTHRPVVYGGFLTGDTSLRLELVTGGGITGIVRDDVGSRVSGADVTAFGRTATTDGRGRYEITGVPNEDTWIEARATGHVTANHDLLAWEGDETTTRTHDFRLERSGTLRLSISLPPGAPIPAWWQVAIGSTLHTTRLKTGFEWNDGNVVLDDVPAGLLAVGVLVPGYLVRRVRASVSRGSESDARIGELTPAPLLRGAVLQGSTGVADVRVRIQSDQLIELDGQLVGDGEFFRGVDFPAAVTVRTDASGAFETRLRRRDGKLVATLDDGFVVETGYEHEKEGDVHEIELPPRIRVSGVVRDAEQRPVHGATVVSSATVGERMEGLEWHSSVHADQWGAFTLAVSTSARSLQAYHPVGGNAKYTPEGGLAEQGGAIELVLKP